MNQEALDKIVHAANLMAGKRFAVLTGAGISTDSGIPDYRSPESPKRKPMTIDRFQESDTHYRRYWMGSFYGYSHMKRVSPNPGHYALARLENTGHINGILTQNVDSLHEHAGSKNVIHLHGNMEHVRCLTHGHVFKRSEITAWMKEANPGMDLENVRINPDGDAEVELVNEFKAPVCSICGSRIKPDVIYFGELMLPETVEAASKIIDNAEGLLVIGSSLTVNSGYRFYNRIIQSGRPSIIINRGPVKGQETADLKINAGISENLPKIVEMLTTKQS